MHKGQLRQRVRSIGIELEGGWMRGFANKGAIIHDGSVKFAHPDMPVSIRDSYAAGKITETQANRLWEEFLALYHPAFIGELPSPPFFLSGPRMSKDPNKSWVKWLRDNYPEKVNDTCGMHVHMGFENNFIYQQLITPSYQQFMMNGLLDWATGQLPSDHHIFGRLNGSSEYCQLKYFPDEQIDNVSKDYNRTRVGCRYTAIHYCWGRYRTIEIRVLPMMPTKELAQEAIEVTIKFTNQFLASNSNRSRQLAPLLEVDVDTTSDIRSAIECV